MSTPLYVKIRTGLEARIHSGDLPPGARMPTEAELQAEHGVSRSVAQRVLNDLAHAGLVVRQKRLGTHVAEGARQVNLLRSIDPRIGSAGIPGRTAVVSAGVMPAGKAEVDVPGIDDDEAVIQLVRVNYDQDEKPFMVEVAAIPFSLAPRLLEEELEELAVRAYFASTGVQIARSRMYFDPILLEQRHAVLLGIDPGVAVLRRRRLMWQPNGQIAESTAYYLRPDAIDFYVEYSEQNH
ncbi:GntR family transcriptional regulator [Pseudarthrobacter sp. HLT3-5]|uniref:GntR family transcriptional regulator n=1 Tax=Pseudarthrobacter cellobiosi TaxID=2953654 RepID=UPI00208FD365|nr:GntR family transcriptional regulator [Pseudarthrobacter sp. HLT3-5]MCO4276013.1 GntR family transcriptional regulator [Pseudarthrobacter sp. HLT3-5]